jgi:hypothetical protein
MKFGKLEEVSDRSNFEKVVLVEDAAAIFLESSVQGDEKQFINLSSGTTISKNSRALRHLLGNIAVGKNIYYVKNKLHSDLLKHIEVMLESLNSLVGIEKVKAENLCKILDIFFNSISVQIRIDEEDKNFIYKHFFEKLNQNPNVKSQPLHKKKSSESKDGSESLGEGDSTNNKRNVSEEKNEGGRESSKDSNNTEIAVPSQFIKKLSSGDLEKELRTKFGPETKVKLADDRRSADITIPSNGSGDEGKGGKIAVAKDKDNVVIRSSNPSNRVIDAMADIMKEAGVGSSPGAKIRIKIEGGGPAETEKLREMIYLKLMERGLNVHEDDLPKSQGILSEGLESYKKAQSSVPIARLSKANGCIPGLADFGSSSPTSTDSPTPTPTPTDPSIPTDSPTDSPTLPSPFST